MIKQAATTASALVALMMLGACSSTASNLTVTERSVQSQCDGISSGLTQVTQKTIERLQQRQFLTETTDGKSGAAQAEDEVLVAVSHGAQPSPGYRFELRSATIAEGTAQLNLHWVTPQPGSIQATVMTSPCLVLALSKGGYQRVVAQDQNGVIGVVELAP